MTVDERIELLKSNILHYTKDLLHFDVVEIRLLDQQTGRLEPLLAVGMEPAGGRARAVCQAAGQRRDGVSSPPPARAICAKTRREDPLYLEGCKGAKSSLTVPLILHDQVIGTFNVESPEPRAFTENDLMFLEIFTRDVAAALNTLELLVAEKATRRGPKRRGDPRGGGPAGRRHSQRRRERDGALHRPRAGSGRAAAAHSPQRARHQAGDPEGRPEDGPRPGACRRPRNPKNAPALRGRRVLVVDADDAVRGAAHALLERYGCVVETAHDGGRGGLHGPQLGR